MGRKVSTVISSDPEINEIRKNGIWVMETFNKDPYRVLKEDKIWFWKDWDSQENCSKEDAWSYVDSNYEVLEEQYPFLVSSWIQEFYTNVTDSLFYHWEEDTEEVDWNIFFSIVRPIPGNLAVPFRLMIWKLYFKELRDVKEYIRNFCWEDRTLRDKLLKNEIVPSRITKYIPYPTLRKYIVEKSRKELLEVRRQATRAMERNPKTEWLIAAEELSKQGKTPEEIYKILTKKLTYNRPPMSIS